MEKKRKNIIINASVLIIGFAVMMAALAYNPSKVPKITVFGTVTDEDGHPLGNVTVQASSTIDEEPDGHNTNTDGSGHYSIVMEHSDDLSVTANPDTPANFPYWMRWRSFDVSSNPASIQCDLVLQRDINVTLPLGLVFICDTINGSTNNNISVDLRGLNLDLDTPLINQTWAPLAYSPINDTFAFTSSNRTCMSLYMNVTLNGMTDNDGKILYLLTRHVGEIFAKPIDPSILNEEVASENHSVFNLSRGEVGKLHAIEEASEWNLPSALNFSFSMDYLGNEAVVKEEAICFSSYDINVSAVTVAIQPLTDGVHSYDVCVINGCIVHIRETTE